VNHRLRIENHLYDIETGAGLTSQDEHGRNLLTDHAVSGVEVA
jgi:hypothetical protein